MTKKYDYTQSWFSEKDFSGHLKIDPDKELKILEIGSLEGMSTVWFLENLIKNPKSTITCIDPWLEYTQNSTSENTYKSSENRDSIYHRFVSNIEKTGKSNSVKIHRGFSSDVLKELFINKESFDIIFIDGNHTAKFVLEDSVLSYSLLNNDGYMIWDDYEWKNPFVQSTELTTPKLGVDSFLACYKDHFKVLHKGYKMVVRKLS